MSLSVTLITFDPESNQILNSEPYPQNGEDLAGFESWRTKVYASQPFKDRGATYLPKLDGDDLMISGEHLKPFKAEVQILISYLESLGIELGIDAEQLEFRLNNILKATKTAIERDQTVWIS